MSNPYGNQPSRQLGLFDAPSERADSPAPARESAIGASLAFCAQVGADGSVSAIPDLVALCERLTGWGTHRAPPEQRAALDALARIGGAEAAAAVGRMLEQGVFGPPIMGHALDVAWRLRAPVPAKRVRDSLHAADPDERVAACRCARTTHRLGAELRKLLTDPFPDVARSAACALGAMGDGTARPALMALLEQAPAADAIAALGACADETATIALGRLALRVPGWRADAIAALESLDTPLAEQWIERLRPIV